MVSANKFHGSFNTIDDSYTQACAADKAKNLNLIVLNLISSVNKTNCLVQHETFGRKCRLNESVFNRNQKWNHGKFWCDCKELNSWSSSKDYYMRSPSMYDCQWNKAM